MNLTNLRLASVAVILLATSVSGLSQAADPAFVGKLALAVEPEIAKELGLSDEVVVKLKEIVDRRETEAVDLAAEVRGLTPAEQAAKMAPFVAESEKLGLELLTEEQRAKLDQLRIAKAGMSGLADPTIAEPLKITAEQKGQIDKLVGEYKTVMATGTEAQKQAARSYYEKKIASLLTDEQRTTWEKLSGVPAGAAPAAAATASATTASAVTGPGSAPGPGGPFRGPSGSGGPPAGGPGAPPRYVGAIVRDDGKLQFQFRFAPYRDVIDWFCQQAGLSLVNPDVYPAGTFNYSSPKAYTPEEALDILNRVLATKGYTLVRFESMAIIFNLEDGPVPKEFVDIVKPEELSDRGSFELVSTVIQLSRMTPEEAEAEARKLLGPQGSIVLLSKARQVWITDHASKLQTIYEMIQAVENPQAPKDEKVAVVKLKHLLPSEFMGMARTLLGIPENAAATPDGTLKIATDEIGGMIVVSGKQASIERVEEIVKLVDVDSGAIGPEVDPLDQPQLEVYPVTQADPAAVLQVMQTLLAGMPDVRLATDPKTGNLVALAKPSQHATIKVTLDQMQRDGSEVEVYTLRTLDPSSVMLEINSLFGDPTGKDPNAAAKAPRVFADAINMTLTVYGNPGQLERIRDLLTKKGEIGDPAAELLTERSNIRVLPLTGRAQRSVLDQIQAVWPTMRPNRIRIVTPTSRSAESGANIRGPYRSPQTDISLEDFLPFTPEQLGPPPAEEARESGSKGEGEKPAATQPAAKPAAAPVVPEAKPAAVPAEERMTQQGPRGSQFVSRQGILVSRPLAAPPEPAGNAPRDVPAEVEPVPAASAPASPVNDAPAVDSSGPAADTIRPADQPPAESPALPDDAPTANSPATETPAADAPAPAADGEAAEIVVTTGPGGITIASKDLDALDDFEDLLQTLNDTVPAGKDFNVYYLKYVKAETAANLLTEILSGGSGDTGDDAGGGLMGDLASQMIGGMTGDLLGGILGPSGGGTTTTTGGTLSIIPDPRLNCLFVTASARDLDSIDQLLERIDTPESIIEPQTTPPARFIPVQNGSAESIATVVRQVFASRMQADTSSQQRQPSPEDFIRALRGGGGGRGGNRQQNRGEEQKMTIGVDVESNSLIVSAPDYLFREVEVLVKNLDRAYGNSDQTVRVVTLKRASTDLIQRSLQSVLGTSATVNATTGSTSTASSASSGRPSGSTGGPPSPNPSPQPDQGDAARRQMEFMQSIQRQIQDGGGRGSSRGGDSGRSSRGSRGGFGGGGFPGGGGFGGRP